MSKPCINWPGSITWDGYGRIGKRLAHRVVWEDNFGPIPNGLTVDHTCFNRACVEITHMQLLTHAENARRKSFYSEECFKCGHPRTEANTQITRRKSGTIKRACKTCKRNRAYKSYHSKRLGYPI